VQWALEERGHCSVLDDSGRELEFVAHGNDMTEMTNKDRR
jgi:hypothetical protein